MLLHISRQDLDRFAEQFWKEVKGARVFAFHGPMGSGKTTAIAALCRHKGVREPVSSPTFAIIQEYSFTEGGTEQKICHMDLYRLNSEEEVVQSGVEDAVA